MTLEEPSHEPRANGEPGRKLRVPMDINYIHDVSTEHKLIDMLELA